MVMIEERILHHGWYHQSEQWKMNPSSAIHKMVMRYRPHHQHFDAVRGHIDDNCSDVEHSYDIPLPPPSLRPPSPGGVQLHQSIGQSTPFRNR